MGKKDFQSIYENAKAALGSVSCRISGWSDCFQDDPNAQYAGVILYHKHDSFQWKHERDGVEHNARSFYVIIQNTALWRQGAIHDRVGEGQVHDYLYKALCGEDFTSKSYCCAGFSLRCGEITHSSAWLNCSERLDSAYTWKSDNDKMLSKGEVAVVRSAINCWIRNGQNSTFQIGKDENCPIQRAIYQAAALETPLKATYAPASGDDLKQPLMDAQKEIDALLKETLRVFMPQGVCEMEREAVAPVTSARAPEGRTMSLPTPPAKVAMHETRFSPVVSAPPVISAPVHGRLQESRVNKPQTTKNRGCLKIKALFSAVMPSRMMEAKFE